MKKGLLRLNALLPKARTAYRGRVSGLPLQQDVEVVRDRWGIPHVSASNEHDLYLAQGFLHAQDRLWQLESIRRLTVGLLAEVGGRGFAHLDHFARLAGFDRVRDRALKATSPHGLRALEAYTEGINGYLAFAGNRLPLEFRVLHIPKRTWTPGDLCGVLSMNAWFLQTNYHEEITALLARGRLDAETYNELFPSNPGVRLPAEDFFKRYGSKRFGPLSKAALAFYAELEAVSGGSNNWVVSEGEGGKPLLANDPHLGMMVPQVWHLCHLSCPGTNVAGASMVGVPGIIIGRNERVAWGLTNVMTDVVDLYAFEVDPRNPTRYRLGDRELSMDSERILIPVAGESAYEATVYKTTQGPLITEPTPGAEAVAALKWYGTLPDGAYEDTTFDGFFRLARAQSVAEAIECGSLIKTVGQNLVAGDAQGEIAWHATGLAPIRSGYSGRAPADGSSEHDAWSGFLPYDRLPSLRNPPEGWIATANHRSVDEESEITYAWCAPFRVERIRNLLKVHPNPTVEQFGKIQLDRYALQAERLLPRVLAQEYRDPLAKEAAAILRAWDRGMEPGSVGALVFSVFHTEAMRCLLAETLGESLPIVLSFAPLFFSALDSLLLTGEAPRLLAKTRFAAGGLAALCEDALKQAMTAISAILGPDRRRWSWGRLHTYLYEHPGAAGRDGISGSLFAWLLNRGPYPSGGGATTLNVSAFNPSREDGKLAAYRALTVPSIRFVASLADPDRTFIVAPMGQSGQPGDRHYDDMIALWIGGELLPLPLTPAGVQAAARTRLTLAAAAGGPDSASRTSGAETAKESARSAVEKQ